GFPGATAYLGTKAALEQFTKGLAHELSSRGVTVNTVSPGFTDTAMLWDSFRETAAQMTPLGRLGKPGDIAGRSRLYRERPGTLAHGSDNSSWWGCSDVTRNLSGDTPQGRLRTLLNSKSLDSRSFHDLISANTPWITDRSEVTASRLILIS